MARAADERFTDLGFEDFRQMASDASLSQYEKIGFPDEYRQGSEEAIFQDIVTKLPALSAHGRTVIDIGPGCSDLPRMIQESCARNRNTLVLVDSPEMLAQLPDTPGTVKVAGRFPDCHELFERFSGRADGVLTYSVVQHVAVDGDVGDFLDQALKLLSHGGSLLVGDVPNLSKRKRFFSSPAGRDFHRRFMGTDEPPALEALERGAIDDAVVLDLLSRARRAGCDAYVIPQPERLPMANRREDIVIRRP
jgi:hypothetical protein